MKTRLPNGWHSLTPRIVTDDVGGLVEFLRRAFGATGEVHADRPAVMRIGDSMIMVSGIGPRAAMPAFLYLYLDDADAAYQRALEAGARSLLIEVSRSNPLGPGTNAERPLRFRHRLVKRRPSSCVPGPKPRMPEPHPRRRPLRQAGCP